MKYLKTYEKFTINKYQSFDTLSMMDLYDIAKWGLISEYKDSGAWDCADNKNDIDKAIKCTRDDFRQFLNTDFPLGLKNFPAVATLYRFITAIDGRINKKHLGKSWFAHPDIIEKGKLEGEDFFFSELQHLTKNKQENHKLYIVEADIPIEKIDIPRTLWQRSTQYRENEVVLKDDTGIKIKSIKEK